MLSLASFSILVAATDRSRYQHYIDEKLRRSHAAPEADWLLLDRPRQVSRAIWTVDAARVSHYQMSSPRHAALVRQQLFPFKLRFAARSDTIS